MNNPEALTQVENIRARALGKYPKQKSLTNELYDAITVMLSVDYASISSSGKRLATLKKHTLSIVKKALEKGGHKNYLLDLIDVFSDPVIAAHFYPLFGDKSDDARFILKGVRWRLFAWQGFEGHEQERIEHIERFLR